MNQSPGKIIVQKSFIELPSIPIGLLFPVELPISLSNIGETSLRFEINLALFEKENPKFIAKKIVGFGNPKGQLAALKEGSLFVYYRPNQVKIYSFDVELIIFNFFKEIQRIKISLKGTPHSHLDNGLLNTFFKNDDIFLKERLQFEVEPDAVYISDDLINFKNLRLGVPETRIFFLINNSKTKSYAFNFLLFQMSR